MFSGAAAFNQPLATWNTSLVTDMTAMFFEAIAFNQDISSWNTGAVENMRSMFEEATAFNQDLNNWNTDKVTNMSDMFLEATAFNQDISSWDLSLKPLIEQMFLKSAVPGTANNNAIYTTWQTKYGYTDAQLKAAGLTTPPPTPTPTPAPIPTSNICFPAGTPIQTDQGIVNIEKLNKLKHTIHGQIILHITKTVTLDPYLICFNKHSICRNSPMKTTVMTKDHKLMFEGKMVPAYRLLDYSSEIKKVKYSGEVLYNVLLHTHGLINVNGLLCETLDPENIIAKLYRHNYNETERNDIIILMNRSLKDRDLVEYTSVVNRLQRI
jgi:surface protein